MAQSLVNPVGKARYAVEETFDGRPDGGPALNSRCGPKAEDRVVGQIPDERGPVLRINCSKQAADIAIGGLLGTH